MVNDAENQTKLSPVSARPRFWRAWTFALCGTGLLVLLVTLPPFVGVEARTVLMHGFASVCHQIPTRSPHIDGVALAVCHRCYGIYWGLPLAVLGFLGLYRWDPFLRRHAPWVLAASVVPLGIDWLGDVLGFWINTPHSRMITGGFFGIVAGYYLARGLIEAMAPKRATEAVVHAEPPQEAEGFSEERGHVS